MKKDSRKLSHSQNFLWNHEFVRSLIDKTDIGSSDLVVEIGPGKGIITRTLAKRAGRVIGVEFDSELAAELKNQFLNYPSVEIVKTNFLTWDLPREPYKDFANLPFNMTADIVNKLLTGQNSPETTYLVMQDKAAERFIGQPVGPNSQVSILLKPFYDMDIITRIERGQFEPRPNVDAVLARFEKRSLSKVNPRVRQLYRDFVIYGFNQWQPGIIDAFRKIFSRGQLKIMARNLGISGLKPSELKVEHWLEMFEVFLNHGSLEKKGQVSGTEKGEQDKHSRRQKLHRTRAN